MRLILFFIELVLTASYIWKLVQFKKNPFGKPQAEVDFACVYNIIRPVF